jgi:hypothetical protein
MANSKFKNKNQIKPKDKKTAPNRAIQIMFIIFSIILVLSIVLSLTINF